jgi:hypothetical protein
MIVPSKQELVKILPKINAGVSFTLGRVIQRQTLT